MSVGSFGQTNSDTSNVFAFRKDTFNYFTIVDTNYSKYTLPQEFRKPKEWKKADKSRKEPYVSLYCGPYTDTFNLEDVMEIIDTTTNLSLLGAAETWCIHHYRQAFPYLVTRLSDKRKIGLKNTADLIISDRMGIDLKFYGHGRGMKEDVFTIAGRASWILNELTGEEFAVVHGNMTEQDADQFKKSWLKYINALK